MLRKGFVRMDRFVANIVLASRLSSACVLLIGLTGCQNTPTTVSGSVSVDGKPLSITTDSRGTVLFQPVSGQGTTPSGLLDSTGHFKLAIGGSSVISPGEYNVAISVSQLLPPSEGTEQGAKRITPTKYASASESGLKAKVLPGENRLSFDIASDADDQGPVPAASPPSNETQSPAGESKDN
jgi:hypothetical protein